MNSIADTEIKVTARLVRGSMSCKYTMTVTVAEYHHIYLPKGMSLAISNSDHEKYLMYFGLVDDVNKKMSKNMENKTKKKMKKKMKRIKKKLQRIDTSLGCEV